PASPAVRYRAGEETGRTASFQALDDPLLRHLLQPRFGQPEARDETDQVDREPDTGSDERHFGRRIQAIGRNRQRSRDPRERGPDEPPADVRRKALSRATEMNRVHPREVVAP